MNEQPTHGIRVRFDLQRGSDDVATYDVTVYEPDHRFGLVASLDSASGHVSLAPAGEKTPGWVAGGSASPGCPGSAGGSGSYPPVRGWAAGAGRGPHRR